MNNKNVNIARFTDPVVPAKEFFEDYSVGVIKGNRTSDTQKPSDSTADIKVKVLKVIAGNQMLPSSEYPKSYRSS